MTRVNFTFHLGLEVVLVIVNCPTRQYLLLFIGSLHRFPYPEKGNIVQLCARLVTAGASY